MKYLLIIFCLSCLNNIIEVVCESVSVCYYYPLSPSLAINVTKLCPNICCTTRATTESEACCTPSPYWWIIIVVMAGLGLLVAAIIILYANMRYIKRTHPNDFGDIPEDEDYGDGVDGESNNDNKKTAISDMEFDETRFQNQIASFEVNYDDTTPVVVLPAPTIMKA